MLPSDRLVELWPAVGLNVRAGDLELRWIDDELLVQLADLASRGVHDPIEMPFSFPWTRGTELEVARAALTYQWSARQHVGPGCLVLELGVLLDLVVRDGERATIVRYRMTRDRWEDARSVNAGRIGAPVELTGFEAFRQQLDQESRN